MNFAGFPNHTSPAGTDFVTTLPAPIMAFSPIVTPARIVEFAPILAPFFISVFDNDYSDLKKQRIQDKLDTIHSVFGMLSPEEAISVDDSIKEGIKIRNAEI